MRRTSSILIVVLCLAVLAGLMAPLTAAAAPPAARAGAFYVVRPGDTLSGIGKRFGFTVPQLAAFNNIANPNRIFVGQVLRLPPRGFIPTRGGNVVIVQRGDTLSELARQFGTTVRAIMLANSLRSTTIFVGQRLVIPRGVVAPGGRFVVHCVQRGDTLSGLAVRYGTTVRAIMALNNLRSTTIFVGQCLLIDP